MEVSRSGYYKYLGKRNNKKIDKYFVLISKVKEIHEETRGSYGTRRMSKSLRNYGYNVGRYQARSLMKRAEISVKSCKKFKVTTDSKHDLPTAPNLLNRNFQINRIDSVWCSDISYLWTMEGWLYIAVVIDLYSRKVVGWSLSNHINTLLVMEALSMAYWLRKPTKGLIHHSDRGSQYASYDYQKLLSSYGMVCSMSRKGNCWDNAVAESFFHSLKTEWTSKIIYPTRKDARSDVIQYIEMFYNCNRLHSYLGYKSPNVFEKNFILVKAA